MRTATRATADPLHCLRRAVAVLATVVAIAAGAAAAAHASEAVVLKLQVGSTWVSSSATADGLPPASAVQAAPTDPATPTAQPTGERRHQPVRVGAQTTSSVQATGHRRFQPVRIRKRIDAASPLLAQAHQTGRPLPSIVIERRSPTGQVLTYKLTTVTVSSYQTSSRTSSAAGGSGNYDTMEVESISLTYQKIDHL